MLQYTLVENLLTAAPNDFMALPVDVRVHLLEDLARKIMAKHPGLALSEIQAVLEEFFEVVCEVTEEGEGINTPLFNIFPSITGVFESAADNFDSKRHTVRWNIHPGVRLRDAGVKTKTQKVQVSDPVPYIIEVKDTVSGSVNEQITPGSVIQLRGSRLKFLPGEESNGVFLINQEGEELKLTAIVENKPARIIAMLPAEIPQGACFIEVRTSYVGSGKPAKTLKKGRFYKELTV